MRNLSVPLGISVEKRIHHDGAARVGEKLAAQSDKPAARHPKLDANTAVTMIVHVGDFALARSELFHHDANELFRYIDGQIFNRFHQFAIDPFSDDFRLTHHEFVTLAPHHLDQNRELQFAAAK